MNGLRGTERKQSSPTIMLALWDGDVDRPSSGPPVRTSATPPPSGAHPSNNECTCTQEIREAFDLFDTDGSGTIDAKVGVCPALPGP